MNSNSRFKFVDEAYMQAIDYAEKKIQKCNELCKSYTVNNILYEKKTVKNIAIMIILFIFGIVGMIFNGIICKKINEKLLSKYELGKLAEMLQTCFFLICVLSTVLGIYRFAKVIYATKVDGDIRKINDISSSISSKKELALNVKNTVYNSINLGKFPELKMTCGSLDKLQTYFGNFETVGKRSKLMNQIINTLGVIVGFIVLLVIFPTMISDAIVGSMCYTSMLVVILSYSIISSVLLSIIRKLYIWYKKFTKPSAILLFCIFQLRVFLKMKILCSLYIWSKEGIIFIISSLIVIMILFRLNTAVEVRASREGITIPMEDGKDIIMSAAQFKRRLIGPLIRSSLCMLIAPYFMSSILINGVSVKGVILYIVIGIVIFAVDYSYYDSNVPEVLYGKKLIWIRITFVLGYIMLTLSMVPGFGVWSVVLVCVQVSLVFLAILGCNTMV